MHFDIVTGCSVSSGNPDLRPELANGIDLTYEHFLKEGAMFSASVSRRAISDYIRTTLDVDADGRWVYRPVNDGDAYRDAAGTSRETSFTTASARIGLNLEVKL